MTEQAIADGETASHFDQRLTPDSNEGDDLLALFLGTSGDATPCIGRTAGPPSAAEVPVRERPSLLRGRPDSPAGAEPYGERERASLSRTTPNLLRRRDSKTLTLDAPQGPGRHRFGYLPPEVRSRVHRRLVLTAEPRPHGRSRRREPSGRVDVAVDCTTSGGCTRSSPGSTTGCWQHSGRHEAPILAGMPGLSPYEIVASSSQAWFRTERATPSSTSGSASPSGARDSRH